MLEVRPCVMGGPIVKRYFCIRRIRAVNIWSCLHSTADAPPARLAAEAALKSGREHAGLILRLAGAILQK